ncbi:arpin-like [Orbicella faveolata]|uniref:arpin-like n=1 Tax=Orbicella faveolata TaxID=48498 RepID=UPI0009E3FBD6|nr:arpin-like [Orbicella faveolata]
MSRAHMLYDNKPLESIPVTPVRWEKRWEPEELFRSQRPGGVIIEGNIHGQLRFSVTDPFSGSQKWRYVVLHVEISKALKRKFDSSSGKEIEPNYGKDKKVSTGYLMSSYKTSAAGDSDKINPAEAKKMTTVAELSRLTENKLHDSGKNASQAFWCEEKYIDKMELLQGDHVRLKTKGEGPFIEFIVKLEDSSATATNYTGGEGAGSSWTDKVMSFKGRQEIPQDEVAEADDDEWDD